MKEEIYVEASGTSPAGWRVRRAAWGAIFAGVFVTIVIQMMLMLLGAAIGFASINPTREQNPTEGLGLASAIWLIVTGLISTWIGACVAGRLSGGPRRADGMLHGIVTWCVATMTMFYLLATTLGSLIGGAGALLGDTLSSAAPPSENTLAKAEGEIRRIMPQTGSLLPPTGRTEGQTPGQLTQLAAQDPELGAALARMTSSDSQQMEQAREEVVNNLTSKHGMSQEQATTLVNQWHQNFQQMRSQGSQKAREYGEKAASGLSKGALWGFIGLVLGLGAAAWGGWVGTSSLPRYSVETRATAT